MIRGFIQNSKERSVLSIVQHDRFTSDGVIKVKPTAVSDLALKRSVDVFGHSTYFQPLAVLPSFAAEKTSLARISVAIMRCDESAVTILELLKRIQC